MNDPIEAGAAATVDGIAGAEGAVNGDLFAPGETVRPSVPSGTAPRRRKGGLLIHAVNLSGGRSSGYMLHEMLRKHDGELPDSHVVVFCNTGKEREETLDFVARVSEAWGVEVHWLEYRWRPDAAGGAADRIHDVVRVDRATASLNGEPFEQLISAKSMIPHSTSRLCTVELKIETQRRYLRDRFGATEIVSHIGLRFDEPRRWMRRKDDLAIEMPLVYARRTVADVQAFWQASNFDLEIPSWMGNCDLCYLKSNRNLAETVRREPWRADWWLAQETRIRDAVDGDGRPIVTDPTHAQMSKHRSFADVVRMAAMPDAFPAGEIGDEPAIDCFCGESA